jgi:predicted ATPase/DNA-binding CsgD family transcriptional regulator
VVGLRLLGLADQPVVRGLGDELGVSVGCQVVRNVRMHGVLLLLPAASSRRKKHTSVPTTDPATESTTEADLRTGTMERMSGPGVLPKSGISAREAEVLAAIGEHLSNAEISTKLFISVRTVESHVSSLLRKLGATDRRELADLATRMSQADREPIATLPSPLTSFVGRGSERAALAQALRQHREVTAVGPGGVGKTRLALAVIADAIDEFADGIWFVDLVPVSDPHRVENAVAAAMGIGEGHEGSTGEAIVAALATGRTLLTLDNCEHVLDGVAPLVERLLSDCPRLTVLATSRARLMVPFEWVFPVPPLSLPGDDGRSDAVALFMERAQAAGWPLDAMDTGQVADVCRALDGVALAIELAVARLPVLGLDGLHAGMSDQLRLLAGGRRADDRHRSVRAVLDWSHALLAEAEQTLLRRIAVFAASFTPDAAAQVAGFPPIDTAAVPDGLAHLTEQSLLTVLPTATGTRYRALETIRQYGLERLIATGDLDETRSRHLRWCLTAAAELEGEDQADRGRWRGRFDQVADELRAALGWAADQPDHQTEAFQLTMALARLTFTRGLIRESQQRYEQAAGLAINPREAAEAYRWAGAAAMCRFAGTDAFRLRRAAARTALQAGDHAAAAFYLADSAAVILRAPGIMSPTLAPEEAAKLIEAAHSIDDRSPTAEAAIAVAEASRAAVSNAEPAHVTLAESAAELARQVGEPLMESGALDALTGAFAGLGMVTEAARAARRRLDVLTPLPLDATVGYELLDALNMACEYYVGAGDLPTARAWAERVRDLPISVEEGHLATAQLIVTDALAGNVDDVRVAGERFREGWERAGRPRSAYLGRPTAAVALAHGLAGDDDSRTEWLALIDALGVSAERLAGYGATFDAILLLHRDQPAAALDRLAAEPEDLRQWISGLWRQWYAALKAEAAVLTGQSEAADRLEHARTIVIGNPIAAAITERAAALLTGDRDAVLATADALSAAACPYQQARSLVLAGEDERDQGIAMMTAMGISTRR